MIEPAYEALAERLAQALTSAGFLPDVAQLKVDPEAPFAPSGDELSIITAAALVKVRTGSVRQLLGRPEGPRYVVERQCRLELAIAGPNRGLRLQVAPEALAAVAVVPGLDPTLGGVCERLVLGEQTDEELPPNGISVFLTFTLRVRSGDPLGMTP